MASIKDISKALGIGVSTVSMALNDNPKIALKTRIMVQEKAREMKYVKSGAALDLRSGKSNVILYVLHDASRSFFSNSIREIQNAVSELGYDFIITTTFGGHTDTAIRYISEKRADAVIIYTKTIDDELINEYANEDFPIFVLGHNARINNPNVHSFMYEKEQGPSPATEYLIEKGHKRIGYVLGFHESYGTIRGLTAFRKSMKDHKLPVDENLIFDADGNMPTDGYRVAREQISKHLDELDAIVFTNDDIAIGALRYFEEAGIDIPGKLSVIGNHNIPASASTNPPLTTVTGSSTVGYYSGVVILLDSYLKKNPDYNLEQELESYTGEDLIVERATVRDLNK